MSKLMGPIDMVVSTPTRLLQSYKEGHLYFGDVRHLVRPSTIRELMHARYLFCTRTEYLNSMPVVLAISALGMLCLTWRVKAGNS